MCPEKSIHIENLTTGAVCAICTREKKMKRKMNGARKHKGIVLWLRSERVRERIIIIKKNLKKDRKKKKP